MQKTTFTDSLIMKRNQESHSQRLFYPAGAYSDNEGEKRENKNKMAVRDLLIYFSCNLRADRTIVEP